jgi:hypothetical protein
MAGQCIQQDELDYKLTEIDIHSLSRGIYAIQILSEDWTIQKKLIKEYNGNPYSTCYDGKKEYTFSA